MTSGDDLRRLRDTVITSGINDVTNDTGEEIVCELVGRIVKAVREQCYDQRIPKMVAGYFADMLIVLRGLAHQTVPGATVCIDIGDSRYGGVHVPTQSVLIELAAMAGFEVVETVLAVNEVVPAEPDKLTGLVRGDGHRDDERLTLPDQVRLRLLNLVFTAG
jgi:hypothetical protein